MSEERRQAESARSGADVGRLLAASEGYQVLASDGHFVGTVDHLRYGHYADRPDEVVIARRNFLWKRRRVVRFDAIESVRPDDGTVVLTIDRRESDELPRA